MSGQVRIVEAICDECGPRLGFFDDEGNEIRLPAVVNVEEWLDCVIDCTCGGSVRIATEPIELDEVPA